MQTTPYQFQNPHSRLHRAGRLAWRVAYRLAFRTTPWFMEKWRFWLLRRFGARIRTGRIDPTSEVWAPWRLDMGTFVCIDREVNLYNVFGIKLGDRVIISQGAFLCSATHDYRDPNYALTGGCITVEDDCWIAADAFIGPGVTIGRGAVVGARAVVVKDVPPWTVVAGNPARVIKQRNLNGAGPWGSMPSAVAPHRDHAGEVDSRS